METRTGLIKVIAQKGGEKVSEQKKDDLTPEEIQELLGADEIVVVPINFQPQALLKGVELLTQLKKQLIPSPEQLSFNFSCQESRRVEDIVADLEGVIIFPEMALGRDWQVREVVGSRRFWGYCGVFDRERVIRVLAERGVAGYSPETAVSFRPVE